MLQEKLARKEFVVTMEVDPPRGADPWPVFTAIHDLADQLTAVNIADSHAKFPRLFPPDVVQYRKQALGTPENRTEEGTLNGWKHLGSIFAGIYQKKRL